MGFAVLLSAALAAYNNVLNLSPVASTPAYVPVNLAAAAAVLRAGRAAGLDAERAGLSVRALRPGLRLGLPVVAGVALGLLAAAAHPRTRPFLLDERVAGVDAPELAYRTLLRIPLGTVVLEEVAFRGVLYGAWSETLSPRAAAAASSAVFGLWHVVPALDLLRANDVSPGLWPALVAGSVAGTALGGMVLCAMRRRTGGVWAPAIVHAGTNSLATVAAWAAHQRFG